MGRKKEFTGIWIPREVWEDERLSMYDKIVMSVVSGLARGENGCFATNKHLADFCKFSERQVCKSVGVLVSLGYLRTENSGTPTRRIYVSDAERSTHNVRGKNAPCAQSERTTCAVSTHNVRGTNENLPNYYNYNYNNIYNNIYNNAREKEPTLEEVRDYIRERKSSVDPVRFWEYYDASGWVDKKGDPVNWRQKVILWESSEAARGGKPDTEALESSFDVDEFFATAVARTGYEDTADEECPWAGG